MKGPFNSLYSHGFARVAVCVPFVRVADPAYNAERTIGLARRASQAHAAVALFPELGLSAYTNDDLFQSGSRHPFAPPIIRGDNIAASDRCECL
jgi:NAD+ synthase (glutamine-hydrolysing)